MFGITLAIACASQWCTLTVTPVTGIVKVNTASDAWTNYKKIDEQNLFRKFFFMRSVKKFSKKILQQYTYNRYINSFISNATT